MGYLLLVLVGLRNPLAVDKLRHELRRDRDLYRLRLLVVVLKHARPREVSRRREHRAGGAWNLTGGKIVRLISVESDWRICASFIFSLPNSVMAGDTPQHPG